jgi:hypothetical protein
MNGRKSRLRFFPFPIVRVEARDKGKKDVPPAIEAGSRFPFAHFPHREAGGIPAFAKFSIANPQKFLPLPNVPLDP